MSCTHYLTSHWTNNKSSLNVQCTVNNIQLFIDATNKCKAYVVHIITVALNPLYRLMLCYVIVQQANTCNAHESPLMKFNLNVKRMNKLCHAHRSQRSGLHILESIKRLQIQPDVTWVKIPLFYQQNVTVRFGLQIQESTASLTQNYTDSA